MLVWQRELPTIEQNGNFEYLNISTRLKVCSGDLLWRVQFYTSSETGLFECRQGGFSLYALTKQYSPDLDHYR